MAKKPTTPPEPLAVAKAPRKSGRPTSAKPRTPRRKPSPVAPEPVPAAAPTQTPPPNPVGLVGAGYLRSKGLGKSSVDLREMHADFLEHAPAHKAHPAAAEVFLAVAA